MHLLVKAELTLYLPTSSLFEKDKLKSDTYITKS